MEQPRHDLYTAVHKALRRRLFDTASQIEGCDFSERPAREACLGQVRATLELLEEHAHHEDEFVMPRIADANPGVAQRLADAHQRLEQAGAIVRGLLDALATADGELAVGRGPELCHAMNALVSQHVAHMNDEETLANATLWRALSDDQLRELHGALQASVPPARMAQWMGMILPALNVHERIGVMGGMKASAPPEVFQQMMTLGRDAVGTPWHAVEAALG